MRIGYVQTNPVFGRKMNNLDAAVALIESVDADLLVLPELFSTGYFFPNQASLDKLAEPIPDGFTTRKMAGLARKKGCALVFGMAEAKAGKYYNSSVYISPSKEIALYRKVHLFYREQFIFDQGNLKFRTSPFYEYRLGMMICFDYLFPEVCRVLALMGANLVCHPANLVLPYCQMTMPVRSLENKIFTITANRVGADTAGAETLRFTGMSQIIDCRGGVIARASRTKPAIRVVDVDLRESFDKSPTEFNHLFKDRRPEFYGRLLR